jgi:alkylated DNA nucleotide flippase Atl1
VRGGISNRGFGVGVGPFSAGTSWRGGSGGCGFLTWLIVAVLFFLVVAWPFLLGTYVAVQAGAGNPSTARSVVGWIFEIIYIGGVIAWFVLTREKRAQRAAEAAQRQAEVIASGAVYETRAGPSSAYRHGMCTINHRSPEAAARCRYG